MAKISVVMTSYNHKEYIGLAIESIINQTFTDFELIIVDDNSNDGSQDVIRKYEKLDKRIVAIYRDENFGNYVLSTNYAASFAKTDYLIFAQCDDFADKDQLKNLWEIKQKNPKCKVIYSCSNLIDKNGCYLGNDFSCRSVDFKNYCKESTVLPKDMAHKLLVHSCIIPNLSAALVEKALFIKMNGLSTDFKVLADWDFWLRSSLVTDFYYIKEPLNNFRQHDTTIRSSIKIEKQLDELYLMMNNLKKQSNKYTDYYINKAIGDIFWGFVVPITNRNILDILMLIVKSMKVSLYEPILIILSAFQRLLK